MVHYDPYVLLLYKRKPLFGNGTQPCQNLGRLQTTTWCFAMQFDISPWEEVILKRREKGCYFEELDQVLMKKGGIPPAGVVGTIFFLHL